MVEIAEIPGQPDPLYQTLDLLVQVGLLVAPYNVHKRLEAYAYELQRSLNANLGFKAEARFMRALQDGIDFGKWP